MNDQPPIGVIIILLSTLFGTGVLIGTGVLMGSRIGDSENFETGRNQGIIFCTEKKRECAIEYTYLKLKENQK